MSFDNWFFNEYGRAPNPSDIRTLEPVWNAACANKHCDMCTQLGIDLAEARFQLAQAREIIQRNGEI